MVRPPPKHHMIFSGQFDTEDGSAITLDCLIAYDQLLDVRTGEMTTQINSNMRTLCGAASDQVRVEQMQVNIRASEARVRCETHGCTLTYLNSIGCQILFF